MKYLQIQIKDEDIIFSGWHNYPIRYNIEYATEEQLPALIKWVETDLFPFIQDMHEGCKLRYRIVNLKRKQKQFYKWPHSKAAFNTNIHKTNRT